MNGTNLGAVIAHLSDINNNNSTDEISLENSGRFLTISDICNYGVDINEELNFKEKYRSVDCKFGMIRLINYTDFIDSINIVCSEHQCLLIKEMVDRIHHMFKNLVSPFHDKRFETDFIRILWLFPKRPYICHWGNHKYESKVKPILFNQRITLRNVFPFVVELEHDVQNWLHYEDWIDTRTYYRTLAFCEYVDELSHDLDILIKLKGSLSILEKLAYRRTYKYIKILISEIKRFRSELMSPQLNNK